MSKSSNALKDLFLELYADRIIIYMLFAFAYGLKIAAWLLEFFPAEYQNHAFLLIAGLTGILLGLALWLLEKLPSFVMSFIRQRY